MKTKKEHLLMREKGFEVRNQLADSKVKEKAKSHAEIVEIEKVKCHLLRKCLKNRKETNISDSDD